MAQTQLQFKGMAAVKELDKEEDMDLLFNFLITDPLKITHYIAFWRQEAINADEKGKARCEKMIALLLDHAEKQCILTCNVYSFDGAIEAQLEVETKSVKEIKETKPSIATIKDQLGNTVDLSKAALHVVQDSPIAVDEDRILREKYVDIIKKINVEDLTIRVKALYTEGKEDNAKEIATFILGKGLYSGKKAKQWPVDKIEKFLDSCKPKVAESNNDAPAADEDLYKKYEMYLGEHAPTLAGLRAEVTFLLKNEEIDKAFEIGTLILADGLYTDEGATKWSDLQIQEWFTDIKNEIANPKENKETTPAFDVSMLQIYDAIKLKISTEDLTEDQIKAFVVDFVKTNKVENLTIYFGVDSTVEQIEKMYVPFFIGMVKAALDEKGNLKLNVKDEICKMIQSNIDKKEKSLSNVYQNAATLYRKRGEQVSIKEAKETVINIAEEKYPEYYAEIKVALGKTDEPKVAIVQDKVNFETAHPELYEVVKNAKNLDDVYTMAREMEKTQSFTIVSEMIIHLISSGKISDKEGNLVNWELPAVEMWINTMFTPAETVAEAAEKVVLVDPNTPGANTDKPADETQPAAESPTPAAASSEVAGQPEESVSSPEDNTNIPATDIPAPTQNAGVAVEVNADMGYPSDYIMPEEMVPYKDLYVKQGKAEAFWASFRLHIERLMTEGKNKKDITHEMTDAIKAIATDDTLTQCFARNFKKTNVTEMYKTVDRKAIAQEIKGWAELA